jgi:hypothetical protein
MSEGFSRQTRLITVSIIDGWIGLNDLELELLFAFAKFEFWILWLLDGSGNLTVCEVENPPILKFGVYHLFRLGPWLPVRKL